MKTDTDVKPDEVKRMLRSLGWEGDAAADPNAPPPETADAELSDEDPLQGLNIDTYEEVDTLPLPETVVESMAPPQKERVRHLAKGEPDEAEPPAKKSDKDPWSRDVQQLGTVSVTSEELEEYTRALLHDQRFEINVNVWMGTKPVVVRVRSLLVSEREIMAIATAKAIASHPVRSVSNAALLADLVMRMEVLLQVVEFDGVPMRPFDASVEEGVLPEDSPKVDELAKAVRLRFGQTHQAKMMTLVRSVHLFETKQQILEDAFHNRDFPRPVGAY